ncbi:MAG: hypothetical protein GXX94_00635 [Chloroflexi bacterium]|nr:hypothetical protein [Chloroflexota bacterium]
MRFQFRFEPAVCAEALDGRLLLLLSSDPEEEPRYQIHDLDTTQMVFGMDVEGWEPGETVWMGADTFGYPLESLERVPSGRYNVQALLHRYDTFHRSDGHVLKLPMDRGEGQRWSIAPGNLQCAPIPMDLEQGSQGVYGIELDQVIPELPACADTRYVRHLRIQSDRLSRFWGRPMYLGATILLPEGYDAHPEVRYPVMIYHGHHSREFRVGCGFREEPVDAEAEGLEGYDLTKAEYSYRFYCDWTGPDFPRVLLVTIQHANPYYDDSYAVNSANLGPYGDAITYELLPEIERRYRAVGEPWARTLYGGSTGGWEALAAQIMYPEEYNGCWANCPDPVDFRAFTIVNLYEHANAYYSGEGWKRTPRPGQRNYLGEVLTTLEQANHRELALGSHSRSGGQYDAWEAVFSPVGEDGYPRRIWDKRTGEIDRETAAFWREHYDLSHMLERDWASLGPKLVGKLHINIGDMDSFYLNNAVYLLEAFLESTCDPYYAGDVRYGDRFEHCWSGDPDSPNEIARLTVNQRLIPRMMVHMLNTAPEGADVSSWRY